MIFVILSISLVLSLQEFIQKRKKMKSFIVLASVLAFALAKPQTLLHSGLGFYNQGLFGYNPFYYNNLIHHRAAAYTTLPAAVHYAAPAAAAVIAPAFTKTQYHAQDELGQASFGYAHEGQSHAAYRDAFGNVRGSYAYIDPEGKEIRTNYIADSNGFRVESNAFPEAPTVEEAPALVGPEPVQDTPEVQAAKEEFFKTFEEVKARPGQNEEDNSGSEGHSRKKRGLTYTYPALTYATPYSHPIAYTHHPVAYSHHPVAATTLVHHQPAFRSAVLTKVINTPHHAISYRVDK